MGEGCPTARLETIRQELEVLLEAQSVFGMCEVLASTTSTLSLTHQTSTCYKPGDVAQYSGQVVETGG